jgi:hypothetical protein
MTATSDHVVPCAWSDCQQPGSIAQVDRHGVLWATLCEQHSKELDAAVGTFDPADALRAWVKASGGAAALAKRFTVDDLARTVEALLQGGRVQKR